MTNQELKEKICEYNPDALLADGFDEAIIGIGNQHGKQPVVIYSKEKCIDILMKNICKQNTEDRTDDDIYLEAIEYFEYNVSCAYFGENTPIFMEGIDINENF